MQIEPERSYMTAARQVKLYIKTSFPRAVAAYQHVRQWLRRRPLETVFTEIYDNNSWNDPESASGRGSTLARTGVIRPRLPQLLRELQAKTLLDAACGDFNWMQHVELNEIHYIGADIVPELIARNQRLYGRTNRKFITANVSADRLPHADVILCRECLIHLSFARIRLAVSNFKKSGAQYLLCTTHITVTQNLDCADGTGRFVNLQLPPFDFPPPLQLVVEDAEAGKCLGLWRLSEVRG